MKDLRENDTIEVQRNTDLRKTGRKNFRSIHTTRVKMSKFHKFAHLKYSIKYNIDCCQKYIYSETWLKFEILGLCALLK